MNACSPLHVFVYGTLRRGSGHEMHSFLAAWAELLGPASVRGRLYDINGLYPGLKLAGPHSKDACPSAVDGSVGASGCRAPEVNDDDATLVLGEVWRLTQPFSEERAALFLRALDEYEDCAPEDPQPHPYRRTATTVRLDDVGNDTSNRGGGGNRPGWEVAAWVYEYQLDVAEERRVVSGDWLVHLSSMERRQK